MEGNTESLRKAAPQWSLEGDKQLLGMLQKIHQKIMTKCEEANMKLGAMVDALDNTSIDLQNVNNKFMALSNNQFVESRVYDDDVDVSTEANISKTEPPAMEVESEITKLKRSLQRLEEMHEPVHILDSDSSDDEDEGRIIMKPKRMYSHRPLPYIIGTQEWKSVWHAGLLEEESDSDSSVSKQDNIPAEEYSESEPETVPTDKLEHRTISSSSMESEVTSQPQASGQIVRQPAKPADIAAELARRLGGPLQLPASEPVEIQTPPEQTSKKVYRVEKPAPTTIFSDEPPPLDDYQSYKSDYTDDDDIFAELHRKPDSSINKDQNRVSNDLFGGISDNIVEDLFGEVDTRDNDIGNVVDYQEVKASASASQKTPVFDDRQQPKTVTENPVPKPRPTETKAEIEGVIRKPIGGISLFGTNKGTESIGAAILKRSQRKSSNSDEDTNNAKINELKVEKEKIKEEPVNKIIEDLFSKPAKKKTNNEKTIRSAEPEKVETSEKIDLFSDNLFDDIDDIFTNNIVTKPKASKTQKSIFDDDDLFADITLKTPEKHNDKSDTKDIFDKSEGLFGEKVSSLKAEAIIEGNEGNDKGNIESDKKTKGTIRKGLFDDDSDDGLFSDFKAGHKAKLTPTNNDNKSRSTGTAIREVKESVSSNSQVERSLFGNDEFDEILSAQTKPSSERTNLNEATLGKNNYGVENDQISDSSKSSKTDNQVITRKNNLENEIKGSCDIIEENKVATDLIRTSKLEESPSSSDKDIIKANKQFPRTSYLPVEALHHSDAALADDKNISSPDILPESLTSESMEPGAFSDIFTDLPPAFEKPLEPKKSKNINALFDDDSDDEALFFKKNEAISDEKPDLSFSSDRFRIFHDEPPEIDVNFSQKVLKNTSSLVSGESDDELFESSHKFLEPEQTDVSNSVTDVNESIYKISLSKENKEINEVNITKLIEDSVKSQETYDINLQKGFEENAKTDLPEVVSEKSVETLAKKDLIDESDLKKPIGKLKNMNFNINVNTLLPGASLRKSKTNEETDGQPISTKSNEELHIHSPEKTENKMVKSVSFDGDPESEVLDNKYSKQRAKIQVKRRPSSRRARLEAVRKSRIVLAADSTDNSSSFDEPPYKEIVKREKPVDNVNSTSTPGELTSIDILKKNTIAVDITNPTKSPPLPENTQKNTGIFTDTNSSQGDVKSKIVYILNDEDIFSDINLGTSNNTENNKVDSKNVIDIVDDDDDDEFLFKSPNVSTLGKTYENKNVSSSDIMKADPKTSLIIENDQKHSEIAKDKLSITKKSFFDDLSDDENELFGNKNPVVQKTNTFASDSNGELLFVNSIRDSKSNVEVKKEIIKGSLFGDESDDDNDLFGVKIGKSSGNFVQNTTKPKDETPRISRSQEPVFEDPLSMFGDES